jgi:chromosomal replication initiation ATPase DnaA
MSAPPPRQLPLPLVAAASSARADLVADASNAAALAWVDSPDTWPLGRLALFGPEGVGKTHILRAIAAERGWRWVEGPMLDATAALADPAPGTVIDEADRAPETALFHLINRSAEAGAKLLLAGRAPPARWPILLPDLASRLRATQAAGIGAPSDALLAALLGKHLADRQLRVEAAVQTFLLARLPRDAAAIAHAVARLDEAAMAQAAPITRPFARAVLNLGDDRSEDDRSATTHDGASPRPTGMG